MEENVFKSYFNKKDLSSDFDSVYDFESHYDDYFSESKYIVDKKKYKFKLYCMKNINRKELIDNIIYITYKNKPYLFYGIPGMGKSLTLIATLKYIHNHEEVGTFYIHCKLLYFLFNNDHIKAINIMKEEMVYLFQNEYNQYIECCKEIEKYILNKNSTFWDIIRIIEKFLNNSRKKYIFAFDQYNEELIDPENKEIRALYSRNDEKLKIIVFCSMDDIRIKNYKIYEFMLMPNQSIFTTMEIENFMDFEDNNMSIDNGQIFDQTFNKIGKTIKNYNILKYIHDNQTEDDLNNYVDDYKKKIKDYLFKFYKLDKKLDYNFLKCWTNTYYNINSLYEIKDYISFKYFDIKRHPKNEEFQIVYLYPIVEEIMVTIFSEIFYCNVKLKSIFNILDIDGGAKGCVFEKFIIHKMKPNVNDSLVFEYFKIDKIIKCDKFVPKSNENMNNFRKSKETFKKGIYLFEQRIFGGKAFDLAIIEINDNLEIKAYLFQISLKKLFKDIFNIEQLKKNIMDFAGYFSKIYEFYFEEVYFTYIFDYANKNDMISFCNIKNMPYIFFEIEEEKFVDSEGTLLKLDNNNIKDFFINPVEFKNDSFDIRKIKKLDIIDTNQEDHITKFIKKEPFFDIKKSQKIFLALSNDKINNVLKEKKQKRRIFVMKLSREESEKYYYSIYETDKTFAIKNKKQLKHGCLLLYYFNFNDNVIPHVLLQNGNIYKLKFNPGNLIYNIDYFCYEINIRR